MSDIEAQIPSVQSVSQAVSGPPDPSANVSGPSLEGACLLEEELIHEQDK